MVTSYKVLNTTTIKECTPPLQIFLEMLRTMENVSILELGAKIQGEPEAAAIHKREWFSGANIREVITSDVEGGEEIDQVADIHELSKVFGENRFDVINCVVTLEHVAYPWIAAHEIAKTLKIGGLVHIVVPHTFVNHAYPDDYWRFTDHALEILFGFQTGFKVIQSSYTFPCFIHSEEDPDQKNLNSAFLHAVILSKKVKHIDKVVWFKGT